MTLTVGGWRAGWAFASVNGRVAYVHPHRCCRVVQSAGPRRRGEQPLWQIHRRVGAGWQPLPGARYANARVAMQDAEAFWPVRLVQAA